MSGGKLDEVANLLVRYKDQQDQNVQVIHQIMSAEVRSMHDQFHTHIQQTTYRLTDLEATRARSNASGPTGSGSGRGYQIRVPDPKMWEVSMLKDGAHGFRLWRKTFELQVRAIWSDLDKVLGDMREKEEVITESAYYHLISERQCKPEGASELDWNYKYISTKLYSVLHAHCDTDPTKVIEESTERCGFEAYRLLCRAYDPYSAETEVTLLQHILQLGGWTVKGIKQTDSFMREAKARIVLWEKRTKTLKETGTQSGVMTVICTMIFSKFDAEVREKFLNAAARDHDEVSGTELVLTNFDYMKKMVEIVKKVDEQGKAVPMDLGSFAEAHDHSAYVAWNTGEAQEEWTEEWPTAEQEEWPTGETQVLAALYDGRLSLDAFKGKGKGKGDGKGSKGKGKGKGKVKGKGSDGKGPNYAVTAASARPSPAASASGARPYIPGAPDKDDPRFANMQCYNCLLWGHIGKYCPLPDKRLAVKSLKVTEELAPGDSVSQAGSARSMVAAAMPVPGRMRLTMMCSPTPKPGFGQASIFTVLDKDDEEDTPASEAEDMGEVPIIEKSKTTLNRRQRNRKRVANAKAAAKLKLPLRKDQIKQINDNVMIEMMMTPLERRTAKVWMWYPRRTFRKSATDTSSHVQHINTKDSEDMMLEECKQCVGERQHPRYLCSRLNCIDEKCSNVDPEFPNHEADIENARATAIEMSDDPSFQKHVDAMVEAGDDIRRNGSKLVIELSDMVEAKYKTGNFWFDFDELEVTIEQCIDSPGDDESGSDAASWASENYNGGEDPISDTEPESDHIDAEWTVWNGPCQCEAQRPGLLCSSARCRNEEFIGPVRHDDTSSHEEDSESITPLGSDSDSPPVTDEASEGPLYSQDVSGQTALEPKPAVTKKVQAEALISAAREIKAMLDEMPPPPPPIATALRAPRQRRRHAWKKWDPCMHSMCGCKPETEETIEPLNYAEAFPPLLGEGEIYRGILCTMGGLTMRPQQLMTLPGKTTWEKLTLVVDSGASDTVIPPDMLQWLDLRSTHKVGAEYEVANGDIVHNLGERRCIMKLHEKDSDELEMAFQVVEDVHKPLLAVSSIVKQGHDVIFSLADPHILLSSGTKMPMRYTNGTYEVDIYVKKPVFAGQSGR